MAGQLQSLPLWERGLKSALEDKQKKNIAVAPLVGAWIEMKLEKTQSLRGRRSPCGSVD